MANLSNIKTSDSLDEALRSFGLKESERALYRLSLSLGPTPVGKLAELLGFERPYVYTLIEALRTRGLVFSSKRYQRTFIVEPPSVVLEQLRKSRSNLEGLITTVAADLPKYLATYKQGGAATQVLFYEGKEKFLELYDRILEEEAGETLYCGEAEQFLSLVSGKHLDDWIRRRIQRGVKIRTLMIDSPLARTIPTDSTSLRETRYLSSDQARLFQASFQVFGSNVIFWQPVTPVAVVLHDEYIANLHRALFNELWSGA